MSDPSISEGDQLDAAIRNCLKANGLIEVERNHLAGDWIANHSAAELEEALLGAAIRVSKDGCLQVLIATPVTAEGIAYAIVAAKRAEGGGSAT